MKKNILILSCLAIFTVACQKDDYSSNSTSENAISGNQLTTNGTTAARSSYSKKVLVEEFVGTSYGDAPEASRMLTGILRTNPTNIIVASHHNNDVLESPQTDALSNSLSSNGIITYPSALIDRSAVNGFRFVSCSNYQSAINQELTQTANCGIAVSSSINNNNAIIEVYEGFNSSINSMCNVTVYLVEDNIALSNPANYQANNNNNNANSPFYQKGNPMSGYVHQHVVRACVTPAMGKPIKQAAIAPGGTDHQTFTVEIPSNINKNNCSIIAFISKYNGTTSNEVLNVQRVKLGSSVSWN